MASEHTWTSRYPVNIRSAKIIVEDDTAFFSELVSIFLEHLPEQIEELQKSIQTGDFKKIRFIGHRLLGAMRNFGADAACKQANNLEIAAEKEDSPQIGAAFIALDTEIGILKKYISARKWEQYFNNE